MIVRFRFGKLGKVRWTSHRDVARIWERALRRARLPVSYTGGFSPRPQLSFGLALPTGCESVAEYLDVSFGDHIPPEEAANRVVPLMPAGIDVLSSGVPQGDLGSLQQEVSSCTWEIWVPRSTGPELQRAASEVMAASSIPIERERKGRIATDDLRPSLLSISVVEDERIDTFEPREGRGMRHMLEGRDAEVGCGPQLLAELGTRPRGVRPAELARAMGLEFGLSRRTHQWIERDGSKFEPLDLRVAVVAGAKEIAS